MVINHLENHLDCPQRLKVYQEFLGSPDFSNFHISTELS